MKLILVTDAWQPQVNGVVTTLVELVRELERAGHTVQVLHPGLFRNRPCPGYAGVQIAVFPFKALSTMLDDMEFDAIHLATEGPLGWAARAYCRKHQLAFTTAYHTRFPEILHMALRVPLWAGYLLMRTFHKPSAGVMVPTTGMRRMLEAKGFGNLRSWTHGVNTEAFAFRNASTYTPLLGHLAHPVSLCVGRLSYEKNMEAFLQLKVPGTKVVCGVGPLEEALRLRYPEVRWLGVLAREDLAQVYAAADVFVMPSRVETFGLVMLEAMACGTPVAAYPVEGPAEVLGAAVQGGVTHSDLATAWYGALGVSRFAARKRAVEFSWTYAALLFAGYLVPARAGFHLSADKVPHDMVTNLSSNA